ncbi:MAG: MerR family transcriptional regulator, partial [Nitrospirota bacterium]
QNTFLHLSKVSFADTDNFYVLMSEETEIQPVYTIRVASRLTGVSAGTIREYERQGLLRTHRDSQNNHRLFTQAEVKWITHIWHLIHKEGLNYEGIRRLLLTTPCWKVLKCTTEYRNICEVYIDNKSACWSLEKLPGCCVINHRKCQTCKVYDTERDNPYLIPSIFVESDVQG